MKIVLVVGPTQSGSTLLFNMIRILLRNQEYKVDSCWHTLYRQGGYVKEADYLIVKCHAFHDDLKTHADMIFLPLRDFRDSAVSCHKRFQTLNKPSDYEDYVLQNIRQFESWHGHATYVFKYEDYIRNKEAIVNEVAMKLGINVNSINYPCVLHELETLHTGIDCPDTDVLPAPQYDNLLAQDTYRMTLMTKSHNTSGGRVGKYVTEISPKCLECIESNPTISTFLKCYGYALSNDS